MGQTSNTKKTHPAIFNQSSQKSVCLKYLGSCSYYSKTRTCRSTADIFCPLLTTGLLRAKKEKQKCIKVVFYFGKLNDLDPRSLSQFQLKFATQNTIVKSARIIGNFHHQAGPSWSNLLCLSENFAKNKKSWITRQQLALHLHNEPVHDIGWFSTQVFSFLMISFFLAGMSSGYDRGPSKDINSCSTLKKFLQSFSINMI